MATIAKRRDRWVIDFYDNHGKRRWKTMPKGSTKKEAKDELRDIEDGLNRGTYLPDKKVPSFSEVAKDWLEYKKPDIRESTWAMYERILRLHFEDIKSRKINKITIASVEKYINLKTAWIKL